MKIGTEIETVYRISIDEVDFYFPKTALEAGLVWPDELSAEMSGIEDKLVPFAWRLGKVLAKMKDMGWSRVII